MMNIQFTVFGKNNEYRKKGIPYEWNTLFLDGA